MHFWICSPVGPMCCYYCSQITSLTIFHHYVQNTSCLIDDAVMIAHNVRMLEFPQKIHLSYQLNFLSFAHTTVGYLLPNKHL